MVIPISVGGRPCPWITPAGAWGRLWRGLLAAVRGHHPESDPAQGPGVVAAGESSAFIDLFARYHLPLLDYLYGMTRDRELAADLAQDTFVRAWSAAPDLVRITQPRAWLYRIATHIALNAVRHRHHFEWLPLSRVEPEGGGEAADAWAMLSPVELPQTEGDLAAGVAERDAILYASEPLVAACRPTSSGPLTAGAGGQDPLWTSREQRGLGEPSTPGLPLLGSAYRGAEPLDSVPLDLALRLLVPQAGLWSSVARGERTPFGDVLDLCRRLPVGAVGDGVLG